jgi:hypothetical protein
VEKIIATAITPQVAMNGGAINPTVRSIIRASTTADCQGKIAQASEASTSSDTRMRFRWRRSWVRGVVCHYPFFSSRLLLSAPQVATQNGTA